MLNNILLRYIINVRVRIHYKLRRIVENARLKSARISQRSATLERSLFILGTILIFL